VSRKNLLIRLIIFPIIILNLSCEDPHPEVLEYLFFNDDPALLAEVGIGDNKGGKISVTNPSGGETFLDTDTILVEWNVNGDIGGNSVICGFSDNAGLEWSFTGSLDNDGSALIILPDLYYDQTQCLIGIWSEDQQNSHYDVIDSYFNYDADSNYYEILYPNGGEALMMGEFDHIVFRPHGNVGTYLSNLNLYYSLFGRENVLVLIYEDMIDQPESFLNQIQEFINNDLNEKGIDFKKTINHSSTSLLHNKLMLFINFKINCICFCLRKTGSLNNQEITELRYKMQKFYSPVLSKYFGKIGSQIEMSEDWERKINSAFAKSNRNTEILIERDLSKLSWEVEK